METVRPREGRKYGELLPGLKRARGRAGLSQQALAERADLERATISNIETGKRAAQPSTVSKLAEALGVDEGELVVVPKGQPTLFPTNPEERSVVYVKTFWRLLERLDRRLWEAIETPGGVDVPLAEWAAKVETDAWDQVVREMRLMQGIGGMPKEERDAHELVYAALIGFGGTVQAAYDAAVENLTRRAANVVGFDRLQAAMEDRERAKEEGRRLVEEARSA